MSPFNDATGENNYLDLINTFKQTVSYPLIHFLNEIELYYHQLKIENAISIFSDQGRVLVIKDYCYARNKLYVSILMSPQFQRIFFINEAKICIRS
jgi:CDP-glycerol glycerophosphotransferase (TagB/SpsB family)